MKFEDLLSMQGDQQPHPSFLLQQQIDRLQQELEGELQLNRVLQCAINGPIACCQSCSSLSPFLPFKVQMLLAELSVVEDEVISLEEKINELKLIIHDEKKQTRDLRTLHSKGLPPQPVHKHLKKLASRRPAQICDDHYDIDFDYRRHRIARDRRASIGSSIELQFQDEEFGDSRWPKSRKVDTESEYINPNKLSIELVKCLVTIFLKLNNRASCKGKGTGVGMSTSNLTKHTLTCMNSGLVSKATFGCKTPVFPINHGTSHLDPYEILPEPDLTIRDIGQYKNFIQVTRNTLDARRISECLSILHRLRGLMHKLGKVNLNYFSHKQKLAFWINVYNASIMNAFLQHGLPSAQEKLMALVHEASISVGGFELKASTIEHFILRRPSEAKQKEVMDEKETVISESWGLDYPEPNVVFALCRGSWSSPALRFYTADEVMNELEKAKAEYLEASMGITSRKKILVPKLLHWHMKDFADDVESLLEWIYSQLSYKSSLKRLMMECLNQQSPPSRKLVEIQPYVSEFRYMIPV